MNTNRDRKPILAVPQSSATVILRELSQSHDEESRRGTEIPMLLACLVDRLGAPDAEAWVTRQTTGGATPLVAGVVRQVLAGEAPPPEPLAAIKEEAAVRLVDARSTDEQLAALFCNYIAVAGALLHHGTFLTSQPPAAVEVQLIELAAAMREPWSSFFRRASMRCA